MSEQGGEVLAAFIEARLAEDEARAMRAIHSLHLIAFPTRGTSTGFGVFRDDIGVSISGEQVWSPKQALAQVAAIRKAIEAAWADHCQIEGEWGSCQSQEQMAAKWDYPEVVTALATIWADHPDYPTAPAAPAPTSPGASA